MPTMIDVCVGNDVGIEVQMMSDEQCVYVGSMLHTLALRTQSHITHACMADDDKKLLKDISCLP